MAPVRTTIFAAFGMGVLREYSMVRKREVRKNSGPLGASRDDEVTEPV